MPRTNVRPPTARSRLTWHALYAANADVAAMHEYARWPSLLWMHARPADRDPPTPVGNYGVHLASMDLSPPRTALSDTRGDSVRRPGAPTLTSWSSVIIRYGSCSPA
jgi:hypothetical protein